MSGHSKWANIKHRKERSDAKKGKMFSKIGRLIAVAVKEGGSDPESNTKLADAVAKAKAANMPNDTIARSIKKASGDLGSANYEEISYEGYGPGGVALIVEIMTDNRNRTAGDIRHLFDKFGGNLGTTGCVSFMFKKKGVIIVDKSDNVDEEELMMQAIESGAEDINTEQEYYEIFTEPGSFSEIRKGLEDKGYNFDSAEIEMVPDTTTKLNEKQAQTMEKLIDALEDHDDVQNIYHNWEQDK